ncbi:high mobility group B protein 6-like isoform X4 [Zingiber officinale]|uniref:high mobility group B protein 6-like isoform X4 n=1 Tax=Zingiber officinale TaxID=94328 RepID=UPI001C4AE78F|nr:high mobility group B protein 6-like isoform X4 [Zingiber officinale]
MPLSGLDGRWWPWRQKKKEAYQEVVKQENREKEAMKLLEKEHLQKTAMELLEQYLQFQQEVEKEGKKVRKEKDALKQNIRCQLSSCSRKNAVKLCYKRRKPSLRSQR